MKCRDCVCMHGKRGNSGQKECKRAVHTITGKIAYAYIDVHPDDDCHYLEEEQDDKRRSL